MPWLPVRAVRVVGGVSVSVGGHHHAAMLGEERETRSLARLLMCPCDVPLSQLQPPDDWLVLDQGE